MRRLAPWILVGVLGIGVVAGAALGESQRPGAGSSFTVLSGKAAGTWVDDVLATTAAAGSAHFAYGSVTKSADAALRASYVGSGVVDFETGDFRVKQVNRLVQYQQVGGQPTRAVPTTWIEESVGIGKSLYQNLSLPSSDWGKFSGGRDPHRALGLDQASGAENVLSGLAGLVPVSGVAELGPATVHGVSTTRYRVTNASLHYCLAGKQNSVALLTPTTLWVDGEGRIVQAANAESISGLSANIAAALGRSAQPGTPPSTTSTILWFSDFGEPVHVAAPALGPNQSRNVSVIQIRGHANAKAAPKSCRS